MSGHHHHDENISGARLVATILLNFAITLIEIIGGLLSGSLSLISDALHNFSDGIAIIISYIALRLSRQPRNNQYTFGLKRAQILAAVLNSGVLLLFVKRKSLSNTPKTCQADNRVQLRRGFVALNH